MEGKRFYDGEWKSGVATLCYPASEDYGTVIDFKRTKMTKVVIEGDKVAEIRGFENVKEFEFVKGANPETIKFSN